MKDESLIKMGVPSKIYYFAYEEPKSRYEIAQMVYKGKKGENKASANFLKNAKRLKNIGYLDVVPKQKKWKQDKIQSNPKGIMDEIGRLLQERFDYSLTEKDNEYLHEILGSSDFRGYIGLTYQDLLPKKKEDTKADFNAAAKLIEVIGCLSAFCHAVKKDIGFEKKEEFIEGVDIILNMGLQFRDKQQKQYIMDSRKINEMLFDLDIQLLGYLALLSTGGTFFTSIFSNVPGFVKNLLTQYGNKSDLQLS